MTDPMPSQVAFFKTCNVMRGTIHTSLPDISLVVAMDGAPKVDAHIDPKSCEIELTASNDVDVAGLQYLRSAALIDEAPPDVLQQIEPVLLGLRNARERVIHTLKYYCNWPELDESPSSKGVFWSENKSTWNKVSLRITADIYMTPQFTIHEDDLSALQEFISGDERLFFALRHLHKANNESKPRHKWIEATIAAELAIKEFIMQMKPDMETFLMEVPSPPLHKMYGPVLRSIANVECRRLKEIQKGAERRNRLIHRPKEPEPSPKETRLYVNHVEEAIFQLLTIMHPEDGAIRFHARSRDDD